MSANAKTVLLLSALFAAIPANHALAQSPATHCRTAHIAGEPVKFKIRQVSTASQFASMSLHYYDITRDWLQYPDTNPAIKIDDDDQFRIAETSPGVLNLAHSRGGARVARAQLSLHPSGLWASGPVFANGVHVGEYVVYLLQDASPCQHDNQKSGFCRSAHFEYFDLLDGRAQQDRPVHGANVVPISSAEPCINAASQSDEGNGHEGPE